MPDSVVQVLNCLNSMNTDRVSSTGVPSTQTHDGPCNFSYVPDKPGTLACALGCNKTLDVNSGPDGSKPSNLNNNQSIHAQNFPQFGSNDVYVNQLQGASGKQAKDLANSKFIKQLKRVKAAKRVFKQWNNKYPQNNPQLENQMYQKNSSAVPSPWQQAPSNMPFSMPPPFASNLPPPAYPSSSQSNQSHLHVQGQGQGRFNPYGYTPK